MRRWRQPAQAAGEGTQAERTEEVCYCIQVILASKIEISHSADLNGKENLRVPEGGSRVVYLVMTTSSKT